MSPASLHRDLCFELFGFGLGPLCRLLGRLLPGSRCVAPTANGELVISNVAKLARDRLTGRLIMKIDRSRCNNRCAERDLVDHPDQHPLTQCLNPPGAASALQRCADETV